MAAQKPESATQLLSRESAYQEFLQNVLAFPGRDFHPSFQASKAIDERVRRKQSFGADEFPAVKDLYQ